MSTDSEDGNWRTFGDRDPVGPEQMRFARNLCLRCGVRVYHEGMQIHNGWHERLGK